MAKQVNNPTAAPSPKQCSFYRTLSGGKDFPPGTNRQQASDMISALISGGKMPPAGSAPPANAPKPPKVQPKPQPKPVQVAMTRYTWPPNPVPDIPAECQPFASHVVPVTDEEMASFVPRQPYWDWVCDAHADGRFVQLVGEGGCGKSIMGKALACVQQLPYLPISCDGKLNPRVLFGSVSISAGTSGFTEGIFTRMTQVPSVIVLEEKNGLDGSVQMTFNRAFNNREFFIPEADGGRGRMYKLHPKCYMMGDCNPPGAKYTGAQRENVASIDRLQIIKMPQLTHAEIVSILGQTQYADRLAELYLEGNQSIADNGFRGLISLRGLKRAARLLDKGYKEGDAIEMGILNAVELTGGQDAVETLRAVASGKFKF